MRHVSVGPVALRQCQPLCAAHQRSASLLQGCQSSLCRVYRMDSVYRLDSSFLIILLAD